MTEELTSKIRQAFGTQTIYKDSATSGSLFDGRTLPSFVKDFLLKKYINSDGIVDKGGLTTFLDKVIPRHVSEVKDRLGCGEELTLLTRFEIYIDLVKGVRRFAIPDMGIKLKEGIIPDYVHGMAGDIAAERMGEISMTAQDIIDALPEAWKKLSETKN